MRMMPVPPGWLKEDLGECGMLLAVEHRISCKKYGEHHDLSECP